MPGVIPALRGDGKTSEQAEQESEAQPAHRQLFLLHQKAKCLREEIAGTLPGCIPLLLFHEQKF